MDYYKCEWCGGHSNYPLMTGFCSPKCEAEAKEAKATSDAQTYQTAAGFAGLLDMFACWAYDKWKGGSSPSPGSQQQCAERHFTCGNCKQTVIELNHGDLETRGVICPYCRSNNIVQFPAKPADPLPPPVPRPVPRPSQPSTPVTATAVPKQPPQTSDPAEPIPTGSASAGSPKIKDWYYTKSGTKFGPVDFGQLSQLVTAGQLQPTDLVWRDGMPDWAKANTVEGLVSSIRPSSPPQTPV